VIDALPHLLSLTLLVHPWSLSYSSPPQNKNAQHLLVVVIASPEPPGDALGSEAVVPGYRPAGRAAALAPADYARPLRAADMLPRRARILIEAPVLLGLLCLMRIFSTGNENKNFGRWGAVVGLTLKLIDMGLLVKDGEMYRVKDLKGNAGLHKADTATERRSSR